MNFFSTKSPHKIAKESRRKIGREQRSLDRERAQLNRHETKLIANIKQAAKRGNNSETKMLVKQLIDLRSQSNKLLMAKTQLGSINSTTQLMTTTHTISVAVQGANKSIKQINKSSDTQKFKEIMLDFDKETLRMELNENTINETLSNAFDESDDEEIDAITNQVLTEIGIDATATLNVAPTHTPTPTHKYTQKEQREMESDLIKINLPDISKVILE